MKQKIYALDAFFIEKLKLSENDPTMTNKAVGSIWRDLSKPCERLQGPDPRPH